MFLRVSSHLAITSNAISDLRWNDELTDDNVVISLPMTILGTVLAYILHERIEAIVRLDVFAFDLIRLLDIPTVIGCAYVRE